MQRAIMMATVAVAIGLITRDAGAQPTGFLRTIPFVQDADQLPEARTYRLYDLPTQINVRLVFVNESARPIVVSESAMSDVLKLRVRDGRDDALPIDWRGQVVRSDAAVTAPSQDAVQIAAGAVMDYSILIRTSQSERFPPGRYVIDIELGGVAAIPRDERGDRWNGRIIPSTSVQVIVAPPQGARERSAAFRREGRRAKHAKRPGDALSAFERATLADPTDLAARQELGGALLAMGRYKEAIAQLEIAVQRQRSGERSNLPGQLAYAYVASGDEASAIRVLQRTGATETAIQSTIARFRASASSRRK